MKKNNVIINGKNYVLKKFTVFVLLFLSVLFLLVGCADKEHMEQEITTRDWHNFILDPYETEAPIIRKISSSRIMLAGRKVTYSEAYFEQNKEEIYRITEEAIRKLYSGGFEEFEWALSPLVLSRLDGKGCYISARPIYYYDYSRNSLCPERFVLPIFSENFNHIWRAVIDCSSGTPEVQLWYNLFGHGYADLDFLEMPDEKFIWVAEDGENISVSPYFEAILNSGNKIYSASIRDILEIEGDPFHALPYMNMAFSYNELTEESNLIWVDYE